MGHKNKIQNLHGFQGKYYEVISTEPQVDKLGRRQAWECKCICGSIFIEAATRIRSGRRKSCGCKSAEKRIKPKHEPRTTTYLKIIGIYKKCAKERGLVWELSFEECIELFNKNCYYCFKKPSNKLSAQTYTKDEFKIKEGTVFYNGIDRFDNKVGYIISNVVPCCKRCNASKNDMTIEEFKNHIRNLYENFVYERPTWQSDSQESNSKM